MDVNRTPGPAGSSGQFVNSSMPLFSGQVRGQVQSVGNSVNVMDLIFFSRRADNSTIYSCGDKFYIKGGGGAVEVHSPDGWETVLMSSPSFSDGGDRPLRWHRGLWRVANGARAEVTTPLQWRACGLVGLEAPEVVLPDPALAEMALYPFNFPQWPDGDFLKKWLLYDWRNPMPRHQGEGEGGWPAWAIHYSVPERVVPPHLVQNLLDSGAFPNRAIIHAYAKTIARVFPTDDNEDLMYRLTQGKNTQRVCEYFSSPASIKAKARQLVNAGDFGTLELLRDYRNKFKFPTTTDGQVLEMALLSDRRDGGRTPAWSGYYLRWSTCYKYFKMVGPVSDGERQRLLTAALATRSNNSFPRAERYLAQFAILDPQKVPVWDLLEELVLDKMLEGGQWAEQAPPNGPPLAPPAPAWPMIGPPSSAAIGPVQLPLSVASLPGVAPSSLTLLPR
jgi:hypothetical protein